MHIVHGEERLDHTRKFDSQFATHPAKMRQNMAVQCAKRLSNLFAQPWFAGID